MFEWLKTILGESYTEEIDKKVAEEIGKGFVAKADFNAAKEAKKALEAQLAEAGKTIEGFKELDVEGIRREADGWKQKAEQAQREADERVAAIQFDSLLDGSITAAGGRSAKAVKALLDMDSLRGSKNQESDIKTALEALKTESDYLFEKPAAPPPILGGFGGGQLPTPTGMEAIRAAAGLKNL